LRAGERSPVLRPEIGAGFAAGLWRLHAVMPGIKLFYSIILSNEDQFAGQPIVLIYSPHFLNFG
jgi:hypothetical protein